MTDTVYLAVNALGEDAIYVFATPDERDRFLLARTGFASMVEFRADPFPEWYVTDEPVFELAAELLPELRQRGSGSPGAGTVPVPNEGGHVDTEAQSTTGQQGDSPVPEGEQPSADRETVRESTTHASEKVREPADAGDGGDDS